MDEKKMDYDIQIILCSGIRDIERMLCGLRMALASASHGGNVVLFLSGEGVRMVIDSFEELLDAETFEEFNYYMDAIKALGIEIEVCSTCVDKYCNKNTKLEDIVSDDIAFTGMTEMIGRMKNTPTLVF